MSAENILLVLVIVATISLVIRIIVQAISMPTKWKHNNKDVAIDMLVEDIKRAKKRILIYGGRGDIYDGDKILKILGEKNTPVKMVFQNENIATTKLSELAKGKKNISLGYIAGGAYRAHFRVIDHDYVYIEKPHLPDSDNRDYKRFKHARFLPAKYAKQFNTITSSATIV